jgi:DNA-directed RNA polymerase specialized sigma24 family protein
MSDHKGVDKKDFDLQDLRKGSPDAFRLFFLQYYAEFFSFADLLLRDQPSSKNVTSAAFFMLWAKHGDFDGEKNIKAFLYNTIRDNSLDYLRHLQKDPGTKEYAPETRFIGSLPDGVLQDILAFADHFEGSR